MTTYDQLDYEPLLKDKGTRLSIMRAKSQAVHRAGPTRPIQVKLYSEVDQSAESLVATCALSKDHVWLDVSFTMPDGKVSLRAYDYQDLLKTISNNY